MTPRSMPKNNEQLVMQSEGGCPTRSIPARSAEKWLSGLASRYLLGCASFAVERIARGLLDKLGVTLVDGRITLSRRPRVV